MYQLVIPQCRFLFGLSDADTVGSLGESHGCRQFRLKPLMPWRPWKEATHHLEVSRSSHSLPRAAASQRELHVLRNEAASSSCKASQWPQSLCLLDGADGHSTNQSLVAHGIRVDACGRSRQWFAALACLREWSALGEEVSVISIGAATNSLAQCALWKQALQMLAASEASTNTFVANAVLLACCRSKLLGRAARLVQMMIQHGPEPDAVTLNTLLGVYASERLASEAQGLMASAKTLSLEPNLLSFNLYLSAMQRSAKWSCCV